MPKARKTAREKLEKEQERKVVDTAKGKMLVPRPLDIDALVRKIEKGKLATIDQIRKRLAHDFHAGYTCPLCSGMFLRIAAEAAEEDLAQGQQHVTPYWRVIKANGCLNEKLPGGVEGQAARLREEGHTIEPGKGRKPPVVKDFERYLQVL